MCFSLLLMSQTGTAHHLHRATSNQLYLMSHLLTDMPVKIPFIFQSADTFPVVCQLATDYSKQRSFRESFRVNTPPRQTKTEGSLLPATHLDSHLIFERIQINI